MIGELGDAHDATVFAPSQGLLKSQRRLKRLQVCAGYGGRGTKVPRHFPGTWLSRKKGRTAECFRGFGRGSPQHMRGDARRGGQFALHCVVGKLESQEPGEDVVVAQAHKPPSRTCDDLQKTACLSPPEAPITLHVCVACVVRSPYRPTPHVLERDLHSSRSLRNAVRQRAQQGHQYWVQDDPDVMHSSPLPESNGKQQCEVSPWEQMNPATLQCLSDIQNRHDHQEDGTKDTDIARGPSLPKSVSWC